MRDIEFKYVDRVPPKRMTEDSAGIDLPADIDIIIKPGNRVAQLVITPCWYGSIKETDELPGHEIRGCLGSTNGYTRGGPGGPK